MDWQTASAMSQVVLTFLTAIGIIVSLWIGIKTLREVQADRLHRVRPKLIFDKGGQRVHCTLEELNGIPGIDPAYAAHFLRDKPTGAKSRIASRTWGGLTNHGNGTALNATVTIIAQEVEKAGEVFAIDDKKLSDFPYSPELNRLPASPSHIAPNESACFLRLPTPITVDFTGQLTAMDTIASIQYEDIYGNQYETFQELRIWVERPQDSPTVLLTFGKELHGHPIRQAAKKLRASN